MVPAAAMALRWSRPAPPRKAAFRLYRTAAGRWCVASADGLTGGLFFAHEPAIRFARREGDGAPILVLPASPPA